MGLGGINEILTQSQLPVRWPCKVRAGVAVLNRSRPPPPSPSKGKGARGAAFPFKKRLWPQPRVRTVPVLAHEGGDNGSPQTELQGNHHPQQPLQGGPSFLSSSPGRPGAGLSEVLGPSPLSQQSHPGAKELKQGKAQEHSWARATSPELPRGQSLPSLGEPCSEHQHSLHIISLAPLPKPRPMRTTCHPG